MNQNYYVILFSKYSNVPVSKLIGLPVAPVTNAREYTDRKSFGKDTYLLLAVMDEYWFLRIDGNCTVL